MNQRRLFIAILEDDRRRIEMMRSCLGEIAPAMDVSVFDSAHAMIAWLEAHLPDIALVSLDHDLPLPPAADADACEIADPYGTGRMVADYLAARTPCCPVIVHSSNVERAPGMTFALHRAGWTQRRVVPYEDLEWIREAWMPCVAALLSSSAQ